VTSPSIIVYVSRWCGYCGAAKRLLASKGVTFDEISLDDHPELRREVVERSGRMTVPQIFVDDEPLGGYDDLVALDRQGKLDEILGLDAPE
jgi:glutaredoxin 3